MLALQVVEFVSSQNPVFFSLSHTGGRSQNGSDY